MFGLVVFGIAALYLALMYFVMRWAWRKGRAGGGSAVKGIFFAMLGFLAVYLPIFWNYIPVLLKHRSLCEKDAGFTVYVPKEQWVAQHQDAIDKLTKEKVSQQERNSKSTTTADGFRREAYFGGLLIREWGGPSYKILNLEIHRNEKTVRDAKTNELLAKYIDYSTRNRHPDDPIGWIFPNSCFSGKVGERPKDKYSEYSSFNSYLKEDNK